MSKHIVNSLLEFAEEMESSGHECGFLEEAATEIMRLRVQVSDLEAERDQLRAELEKLSRNDLPGMCEAFDRVIEAYHGKTHPFHNPVAADARVALRVLRGICSTITALAAKGE